MTISLVALAAVLVIPILAAGTLALLDDYRLTAKLNVVAALATFCAALFLLLERPIQRFNQPITQSPNRSMNSGT